MEGDLNLFLNSRLLLLRLPNFPPVFNNIPEELNLLDSGREKLVNSIINIHFLLYNVYPRLEFPWVRRAIFENYKKVT